VSENNYAYGKIIKSTSIFGGLQLFNIIISIVRSKLVCIFIGTIGMGISGLLYATINFISGFINLGLEITAVRFISENYANGDSNRLPKIIFVLNRIIWISGIFGVILTFILSEWLSKVTFDNVMYTNSFRWISITLLFKQLTVGKMAVLQGFQKIKSLAKANFLGSFLGLLISLPFYYYMKLDAIVPAIIISSLITLFFSTYYSSKIIFKSKIKISKDEVYKESKSIIFLGLKLSFNTILIGLSSYCLQVYIGKNGGFSNVGLYNAGFVILNSYVGLIFTSMATDYLPRLSAVINDQIKSNQVVLEQTLIGVLIITPIITVFVLFSKYLVLILFSNEFLKIVPMVTIGILGMIFRVVSFSIGYMVILKANTKLFLKCAVGFNVLNFVLSILGYHFYGLLGLGIAFVIHYLLHFIFVKIISFYEFNFVFNSEFIKIYSICLGCCFGTFLSVFIENNFFRSGLLGLLTIFSSVFSFYEINKKVDVISVLSKMKNKIFGLNFKKRI
jgi:O-antigen/teichoic acid export membrane protein